MAVLSKEEFLLAFNNESCGTFVHPWSKSCVGGLWTSFFTSFTGCTKFSAALCLLQIVAKGKNITREQLFSIIEYGVRLTFCGTTLYSLFVGAVCIQRKLFGKFFYHTAVLVPGIIAGLSIFIVRRPKRHFFISAIACSALETFINLKVRTNRKTHPLKLTAIFMLTNSIFMYFLKLWKLNRSGHLMPELWFFTPNHTSKSTDIQLTDEHEEKQRRPCNHIQSCVRSILKETSNYFWYGTAIEVLRIITKNFKIFIRKPKKLVPFLCKMSTLRVAAFAGLYVFLFKITNCALCRAYGKDRPLNSFISGFISGMAVYMYPKDTLIITVFVNLVHVIWRYYGINQKYMRNFHTSEFLFMLFCGFLSHYRIMAPDKCSRFFINLISFASQGMCDQMYSNFQKTLSCSRIQI